MRRFPRLQVTPAYKVAIGALPEHGPVFRAPIVELVAGTPPGCGGKGARRREIGMDAWALEQLRPGLRHSTSASSRCSGRSRVTARPGGVG